MNWYTLAFMAFTGVWGFGNVINGFSEYGGLKAILPWLIIFALYFVPYALMVGELGSAFKDAGGGVSSWIQSTIGARMAYYAGWTYWIVHMPYISQKPNSVLIALSWVVFQDSRISEMNTLTMQLICFGIFILALVLARRGISILKKLASVAGMAMFVMSILYIVLMMAAPAIAGDQTIAIDWSLKTFMPKFDVAFFTSFSILVFSVGGCEKISPYVNKMKDPSKDFAKGMIAMTVMISICAILGTVAMGMMFDSNNIPGDLMTNGAYYAFEKLGSYYHVGKFFVILYALTNLTCQFAVLIMSIDAPLLMLLDSADEEYIPKFFFKRNQYGAYVNGHILVFIIVGLLIIIPAFGIGSVDQLVRWLIRVNAVCMPLRYLWVFVAYIALKKQADKFPTEYHFVKGKGLGIFFGGWCFLITAAACIGGIYSENPFELILNIATPVVFILLGLIMPVVARKENNRENLQ
ncbi:APC family permease [Aequitasia blattaphilus]|uniref:Amino acid permease n=1 Tax=Aequitasia blattaphilus TaxID=2949332 RepID=A0ABT1EAH0_9FIRM|nr:amino acid permease [Aequitasia blattaphilus]MCP1102838.1 amino acid permease [Aequitasia blattaphilus]MCR8615478.1 amino acid permease [Aequitasia blattaphilus]